MIRSRRPLSLLATLLLAAAAITSCAPDGPTAPAGALGSNAVAPSDAPALLSGLLACNPQPYAITQQVVGPEGGTIRVGGHSLVIPSGALASPVLITAEAPSDYVASVRFQPEGLHFARKALLTLDYSSCPAGRLRLLKRIAYTDDYLNILSYLLSWDNLLLMRVSGSLEHFSRYAVAW
jgi:hypothetical protein